MRIDSDTKTALPENFEAHYSHTIKPELERLDARRRKGIKAFWGLAGVGVLGLLLAIASRFVDNGNILVGAGIVLIFAAAGLAVWLQFHLRKLVKQALVAPVCEYLGWEYQRKPADFPVERFYDLRLLHHRSRSDTRTEDGISGKQNGLAFRLCEVEVTDTRSNDEDNRSSKNNVLYRGILLTCQFPRPFTGETRVLRSPDRSLIPKKAGDGTPIESVQLEESRFSRAFHVYASDQVEARYLLNPLFMEHLADLVAHFSPATQAATDMPDAASGIMDKLLSMTNPLSLAFVNQEMLLSIRCKENRFEGGSLRQPLTDRSRVEALLQELKLVPEILDALELEKRD